MTFNDWLNRDYPDWESEYSGNVFAMEDAWNAAITEAQKLSTNTNLRNLYSEMTEFESWRKRNKTDQ